MKTLLTAFCICIIAVSCSKEDESSRVFKAKILGRGCWDVVEILEPKDSRFAESTWLDPLSRNICSSCVGLGNIPEEYRNGQPFYFTIRSVTQDNLYSTYCSPSKYLIVADTFSFTPIR